MRSGRECVNEYIDRLRKARGRALGGEYPFILTASFRVRGPEANNVYTVLDSIFET